MTWQRHGACVGKDPELWFPEKRHRGGTPTSDEPKRICASCPVQLECLRYALEQEPPQWRTGIWGALTPKERDDLVITLRRTA